MRIADLVTVFDAADIETESAFWAGLLDGTVVKEADWHSIRTADGRRLAVQLAPNHTPPDWPDGSPQQMHVDLWVEDLDSLHGVWLRVRFQHLLVPGDAFLLVVRLSDWKSWRVDASPGHQPHGSAWTITDKYLYFGEAGTTAATSQWATQIRRYDLAELDQLATPLGN